VANCVSDGNAAHGSSASVMEAKTNRSNVISMVNSIHKSVLTFSLGLELRWQTGLNGLCCGENI
jgi:hypothetical protein